MKMKHNNKLSEGELDAIISDVTRQTLTELSISQKKRNASDVERFFRKGKGGFNGIRTLVVLTAENPDSMRHPRQFNKKANRSLLQSIKDNGYAYVPAKGVFGGNTENPYVVFNMSVETAKHLCGQFQQTSFVFTELMANGIVHSEYWEKEDINSPYNNKENNYIKKDESDEWKDMADINDNFTVIGKKFKYQIPFPTFESVNSLLYGNIHQILEQEKKRGNVQLNGERLLDFTINRVGMSPYLWRKAITRGFYD